MVLAGQLLIHSHRNNIIMNGMEDDTDTKGTIQMVAMGSWKSKLPPVLIINSANLRVQDTIGQGKSR